MNKQAGRTVSLSRKLLLLGAAPAITMFVVLMIFFTSARLDDAQREITASSQMLADSLAPAVEYAVVSGNQTALDQTLEKSLRKSPADWVRVTNLVGETLSFVAADGGSGEKNPADYEIFESEILQQPLQLQDDRETEGFEPQYDFGSGAMKVGSVLVGVDKAQAAERRLEIIWTSLAVGLAVLLFTMVIVNHLLGRVIAPILNLSKRVQRLIERQIPLAKSWNWKNI